MAGTARIQEPPYHEPGDTLRRVDKELPEDNLELAESILKALRFKGSVARLSGSGLLSRVQGKGTTAYVEQVRLLKRFADALLAFAALMLVAPLMIVIAIIVKIDSPGPILYAQRRIGLRGSWFQALKFRTMCVDADEKLKKILDSDEKLRREFETFHKLENDPRVTRIGRFMRKHSLDELPQLVNVLKGEMALVGPRAYMPFEIVKIDRPRLNELLKVTPGLTGFWQVGGRSTVSFDERIDMDMFYIHNWSIGMDLYILVNTVWIVLFSGGYGSS
ncbi:MAG: hypothetical protein HKN43_16190 [Rhodothermales bacterium]|nr:hypothetical protein [Rhodothermales bacterium]